MTLPAYYLGCPIWACERWHGSLYTRKAPRREWLRQYSRVFNTVEGNSTFYGLPSLESVRRWADESREGFRFALKFPREISHDHRLIGAQRETDEFLQVLALLWEARRLGPTFLQLPKGFSGAHLADLKNYLSRLPREFPYAVELRHEDFFSDPIEHELDEFLRERQVDRVIFDSRPLFSAPPDDPIEHESQQRKPRMPVHTHVTSKHPLVRFVGRNDLHRATPWIREWALVVAGWIEGGLRPFIFTHSPDDTHAPQFARLFHQELSKHTTRVDPLPSWPGEEESSARQLDLF